MTRPRLFPLLLLPLVLLGCESPHSAVASSRAKAPLRPGRLPNDRIRARAAAIDLRAVREVVFEFETDRDTPPYTRIATTRERGEIAAIRAALMRSSRERREYDIEPGTETTRADSITFILSKGETFFSIIDMDPAPRWGSEVGRLHRLYKRRSRPGSLH